jgi:hypothetical protein
VLYWLQREKSGGKEMSIREIKLFQIALPQPPIPVIPVTTTPCKTTYINEDWDNITSDDVPWYYKKNEQGLRQEVYNLSDRTRLYACKNCGIVPAMQERRYVIKAGTVQLACSMECVDAIQNKKEK